jgi:hypothetical protein
LVYDSVVISVLYTSVATRPFSDVDLATLLGEAKLRNDALGVSGILVARGGRFMQLLEGPEFTVSDRIRAIHRDDRHRDFEVLIEETITARRFEGWEMAYKPLDDASVRDVPGFSTFLADETGFAPSFDHTDAAWLLDWFRSEDPLPSA